MNLVDLAIVLLPFQVIKMEVADGFEWFNT